MPSKTFHELFLDELRDLYSAEKQITKALPKLIKAASNAELGRALEGHLDETRGQIERLERIFDDLGESKNGKKCKGMEGLLEEGDEHVEKVPPGSRRDAVIIAGAQRVEHYEIAGYGTARAWAEQMKHDLAVTLLGQSLDEEAAADEKLTKIALGRVLGDGVNEEAGRDGGGSGQKPARKSSTKKAGKKKTKT